MVGFVGTFVPAALVWGWCGVADAVCVWPGSAPDLAARVVAHRPDLGVDYADELGGLLADGAARSGVNPYWALAVAQVESDFDPWAVGPTNDNGVFQITGATARAYRLNHNRLLGDDLEYQVAAFFAILADKLRSPACRGRLACWHSYTPSLRSVYRNKLQQCGVPL